MAAAVDVACFGEVLWDLFREEDETDAAGALYRREIGGAPANVAVVLARLGLNASVVGAVGDDAFGKALGDALADERVETKHLATLAARTGITFVEHDAKGEPSFLFYRHDSADMLVTDADVPAAAAKAKFGLVGSSTLMTESLRGATDAFRAALAKAKGHLVVDLNVRAHLWSDASEMKARIAELASAAAIIKASEGDLEHLAGKRGMSWLQKHAPNATWLLTRGENGAAAVGPHGQVTAPTKRVRCADATGAGDAFLAGALAVLLSSDALPGSEAWKDEKVWARALDVGHILGAKAVSTAGAVRGVLGLDDIRARITTAGTKRSRGKSGASRS